MSGAPKIPDGIEGWHLRVLFNRLGLDPANPKHWEAVEAHLAKNAPGVYMPDDDTTVILERRPQKWDGLALRRLAQRVERLQAWYPKESELAICRELAKHCPEYRYRDRDGEKKMNARTLQRRLEEARKRGLA